MRYLIYRGEMMAQNEAIWFFLCLCFTVLHILAICRVGEYLHEIGIILAKLNQSRRG